MVEDPERTSPLWKGRLRFPGDASTGTVIGSAGLVEGFFGVPAVKPVAGLGLVAVLAGQIQGEAPAAR